MNSNDNYRQTDIIDEARYLIVKFQIKGTLRFLSHSQMLNVFQRAVIRAGINPRYSQGFNPRPKISLPLPRPVGVESDDELLVLCINSDPKSTYASIVNSGSSLENCYAKQLLKNLSAKLPYGCELQILNIVREKPSFQPCYATYIFTIHSDQMNEDLQNRINNLLAGKSLVVERSIDTKHTSKKIDVRGFLFSIMTQKNSIIVRCKISAAGSIRVQEIMELLDLDTENLACPIKRTNVQWVKQQ